MSPQHASADRMRRVFLAGFTAADLAEPLRSFDATTDAATVREGMAGTADLVLGVRRQGVVEGYVEAARLGDGPLDGLARPVEVARILSENTPLPELVKAVEAHGFVFLAVLGQVSGVVQRRDFEKAPMRMWLFGVITLIEMNITRTIRALYGEAGGIEQLSAGRLEKARALREERTRRGLQVTLADCLQLTDKAAILFSEEENRRFLGWPSGKAVRRTIHDLERLRNHLAHAQELTDSNWPVIVQLAEHVDTLIEGRRMRELVAARANR